jgi:2-iminobutanoate/2-iminopropanoate deaminase
MTMSSIVRAISPEVPEPQPGTWSNCLVAGGIAYLAGMTARGDGDEYAQAKAILTKIRTWSRRPAAAWPTSSR